jgi:hypothetical protein
MTSVVLFVIVAVVACAEHHGGSEPMAYLGFILAVSLGMAEILDAWERRHETKEER